MEGCLKSFDIKHKKMNMYLKIKAFIQFSKSMFTY